uniref:C2H2-type domain-containing protein n=1 Tax=Heterorhabditis bacteriophora TaxID=37862 RepID=A0A1I7X556_HETBA
MSLGYPDLLATVCDSVGIGMANCASPSSHFQYGFYHNPNIENIEKIKHDRTLPQSSFMYYQEQQNNQMNNNQIKNECLRKDLLIINKCIIPKHLSLNGHRMSTYPLPPTQAPLVFYQDHVNSDLNHGYYPYQSNENLPEIESLMRTINEDPDFFQNGSTPFSPVVQQSLHARSQEEYTINQDSPYMDFFQQSPMSASSPCIGLAPFNEPSVTQNLPSVNLMKSLDHTYFENQEQYRHRYSFCDQATSVVIAPPICSQNEATTTSSKDHTIRKLLQTKKKEYRLYLAIPTLFAPPAKLEQHLYGEETT